MRIFTKIKHKLEFYTRNLEKSESNAAINDNKKGSKQSLKQGH